MYVYFVLDPNADPSRQGDIEFKLQAEAIAYGRQRRISSANARRFGLSSNILEFNQPTGADIHFFTTGQEILDRLANYPERSIEKLIIFAHGGPQSIGWGGQRGGGGIHNAIYHLSGWKHISHFARLAGPRLTENCILGLAGCTTGLSIAQYREWRDRRASGVAVTSEEEIAYRFARGDQDSLAGTLRDVLVRSCPGIEVRAHKTRGHTTFNPNVNYFRAPANSPGIPYADDVMGPVGSGDNVIRHHGSWRSQFSGMEATEWIVGGFGQSEVPQRTTGPVASTDRDTGRAVSRTSSRSIPNYGLLIDGRSLSRNIVIFSGNEIYRNLERMAIRVENSLNNGSLEALYA